MDIDTGRFSSKVLLGLGSLPKELDPTECLPRYTTLHFSGY